MADSLASPTLDASRTSWQKLKLVVKVVEVRLRFVAVLAITGLVIGYWDTLGNYWDKWARSPSAGVVAVASDTELYCPMHPSVVRRGLEPNGEVPKCPICGMPLSLRKKGDVPPLPPNVTGRVQLSPDRIRMAGIRTETIGYRPLTKVIRTVGEVTYDESRLSRIVARASGYLEKLYVSETFTTVDKGEPLAEIYSPELYTALQELLISSKGSASRDLIAGTREKLHLLGIGEQEIDELVATGKPQSKIVIRSPRRGHVIHRAVVEGAHVNVGDTLFEVADLSKVWIEAEVFENDIPFLRDHQAIEARVEAYPNRAFDGFASLVHPHLQSETRTNQVRMVLDNPHHILRPGMFATVQIETPVSDIEPFASVAAATSGSTGAPSGPAVSTARVGEVLAVPEPAVVDTGSKKIVYVEREPGLFEGVLVEVGPRVGEFYPVLRGLSVGDRVAARGAFLIDAETRLNPAAGSTFMGAAGGPPSDRAPSPDRSPATNAGTEKAR